MKTMLSNYDLEFTGLIIFWSNILGLMISTIVFLLLDQLNIIPVGFDNFSIIVYVCYSVLLAVQILSVIMIKTGKRRNKINTTVQQEDNVIKENESR